MKSWQTTVMGILAIIATGWKIYISKTVDAQDLAALSAGVGLIAAKDSKVTGGTIQQ